MASSAKVTTLSRIESTIGSDGALRVELRDMSIPALADDEIVIAIGASPANPSDMSLMLGPVDPTSIAVNIADGRKVLTGRIPALFLKSMAARLDRPVEIGNEGAGTIVATGERARHLLGRKCSGLLRGGMFATHRVARAHEVTILPDDLELADAASMYINPLTVLAMIETMRREGHHALIHTAAASSLGQMLVRLCVADGIELVNIVRRAEQVELLRGLGATCVLDSSSPAFADDLRQALQATGATMLFDALGGGTMADFILRTMEEVELDAMREFNRYGSGIHKQAYIYSALVPGPLELVRNYGMTWGVGPFLLPYVLGKFGPRVQQRMEQRVLRDVQTVFATAYTDTIMLDDLLDPDVIARITRRATNAKYLVAPAAAPVA